MTIRADAQRLDVGALVELYEIDIGVAGVDPLRFVPGPWNGVPVTYRGRAYASTPIQLSGLGYTAGVPAGRATLAVSRPDAAIAEAVTAGCRV